jgi:hypothetical protein
MQDLNNLQAELAIVKKQLTVLHIQERKLKDRREELETWLAAMVEPEEITTPPSNGEPLPF